MKNKTKDKILRGGPVCKHCFNVIISKSSHKKGCRTRQMSKDEYAKDNWCRF